MHPKVKDSQIAKHPNDNKHGDIELAWKIGRQDRTVADVTITHPRHGFATDDPSIQVGTWKRGALKAAENGKINKHKEAYNTIDNNPTAFIPIVMSTYGAITEDTLRTLYLITVNTLCIQECAEPSQTEQESNTRRGFLFNRAKLAMGCMIAKAGAMRNIAEANAVLLGTSWSRNGSIPSSPLCSDCDTLYHQVGVARP